MLEIIICVGIPACGKSTWAKAHVAKDPLNWVRVNNDDIRAMVNSSVWSKDYEKVIGSIRSSVILEALKADKNVIVDNVNFNKMVFKDILKTAKSVNKNITIKELPFYIPLEEAVARDKVRTASVGESVINKWWKASNGEKFKHYFARQKTLVPTQSTKIVQDKSLPKAVIFDNDGTISLLNGRNPYDATYCDNDLPHEHVIECLKLYNAAGYKIIFVSGRQEKDRAPTERFYQKHFPEISYELYMRENNSQEPDYLVKENIYLSNIKDRYYVSAWFDDRLQVCKWIHESGLPLFRVNDPEAIF